MELKEAYLLARNNTYKDFKEEIDYRITGQLRTNVSEHEFEVKLILPIVVKSFSDLDGKIIPTKYKVTKHIPNIDVDFG